MKSATILFAFSVCLAAASLQYGGQTYKTVKIGEQTWMAENLNYEAKGSKCYGESGHVITDFDEDDNPVKKTISKKEAQDNCAKYGRLYNWETAKKVCPKGWHLPDIFEMTKLFRFIDDDKGSEIHYGSKYLKSASGWNENGTDDYGFSALPGGNGYSNGNFYNVGHSGRWWSARRGKGREALYMGIEDGKKSAYWNNKDGSNLYSVRCIKD
jgi:uncharacterized protein (TIGR02145 family)